MLASAPGPNRDAKQNYAPKQALGKETCSRLMPAEYAGRLRRFRPSCGPSGRGNSMSHTLSAIARAPRFLEAQWQRLRGRRAGPEPVTARLDRRHGEAGYTLVEI